MPILSTKGTPEEHANRAIESALESMVNVGATRIAGRTETMNPMHAMEIREAFVKRIEEINADTPKPANPNDEHIRVIFDLAIVHYEQHLYFELHARQVPHAP